MIFDDAEVETEWIDDDEQSVQELLETATSPTAAAAARPNLLGDDGTEQLPSRRGIDDGLAPQRTPSRQSRQLPHLQFDTSGTPVLVKEEQATRNTPATADTGDDVQSPEKKTVSTNNTVDTVATTAQHEEKHRRKKKRLCIAAIIAAVLVMAIGIGMGVAIGGSSSSTSSDKTILVTLSPSLAPTLPPKCEWPLDFRDCGEDIDWFSDSLEGTLPTELGLATQLTKLILSLNRLSGSTIPSELGLLTNLKILYLDETRIIGTIPTELGDLTQLAGMDLGKNILSGKIPTELGKLTALKNLFLDANDLTGSLPVELSNLVDLERIFVQGNAGLSGTVASEICALESIVLFRVNCVTVQCLCCDCLS